MINAYMNVNENKKIRELLEELHESNKSILLLTEEENLWALDVYLRKEMSKGKIDEKACHELIKEKFSIKYGEPDLFKYVKDERTGKVLVELDKMAETIRNYKT